jgi:hypothetical protein
VEAIGEPHEALRLAIALRAHHAKIVLDAPIGVVALLLAEHHDTAAAKPAHAAHHRGVLAEGAVARQGHVVGDQAVDVALGVRPFGVARHLDALPRRQLGVGRA